MPPRLAAPLVSCDVERAKGRRAVVAERRRFLAVLLETLLTAHTTVFSAFLDLYAQAVVIG